MWDELDDLNMVIKCDKVSQEDKNHARLLATQIKIVGGKFLITKEITDFFEDMANKYGTIIAKFTLEERIKDLTAEMEQFKAYWGRHTNCRELHIMFSKRMHEYSTQISALKRQLDKY